MKILWYSVFSFLFFCLEPTVSKDIWMRRISVTVMVIFQRCYAKITWYLRATLTAALWKTPDIWRFYRYGSTYMPIFLGQLLWNEFCWRCQQNYHLHKKPGLHLREHLNNMEDDILLIFICFFFCRRNLFFRFDLVLIE